MILLLRSLILLILHFCFLRTGYGQENAMEWKEGEDLVKKTSKYLFLKVSVDKKEAFTGECITAIYQLYVALNIQGQLAKAPSYRGFAAYDIQQADNVSYTVERYNGIPYRVYLIKKVQLFGLKPGTQLLETIELDASVQYQRKPSQKNDDLFTSTDTVFTYTVKSQPISIQIKPLPTPSKQEKVGGVGNFDISGVMSKPVIEANKPDTFTISITGRGNWHEIVVPKVVWPKEFEIFEPAIKESLDPLVIPVQGVRMIQYPVVISRAGSYVIPPVQFSFFNPDNKKFTTLTTDSVRLTVTPPILQKSTPIDDTPSQDIISIFTKFAVVLFPLVAIVLAVLIFFRKKEKNTKE